MLSQGVEQDPKFKLNISSFLTLPHLIDGLICTRNCVHSIVIMIDGRGGGRGQEMGYVGWGWMIHITVWVLSHSFFNYALVFCSLISCLFF